VAPGAEVFSILTVPVPPRARPAALRQRPAPRRPALARGLLLRPFYWTNRAFDRWTERLGRPGRWLRGRRGRTTLGWAGVLLLAGALGWQLLAWLGCGW
jgi:hypothetical protein